MARVYSSIRKFKRVEAALREAANGHRKAIREIDSALVKKRTKAEIQLLNSIREKCVQLNVQSRSVVADLWDGVDQLSK